MRRAQRIAADSGGFLSYNKHLKTQRPQTPRRARGIGGSPTADGEQAACAGGTAADARRVHARIRGIAAVGGT